MSKGKSTIFPIRRNAIETPHYTQSPRDYRGEFQRARPAGKSYYAYDVIVLSRTQVEFVAYDLRDTYYGGIGDELFRFKAAVPESVTRDDVERAILDAAIAQREAELRAAEAVIIRGYADEIRSIPESTP